MYRYIDIRKHHSAAALLCVYVCVQNFSHQKNNQKIFPQYKFSHTSPLSLSLSLSLTHTQNTESSKTPTQYHFAHEILRNSEFQISQNREREREREREMAHLITQNSIARIHDNPKDTSYHPIVQVISVKKIKTGKSQASTVVRFLFFSRFSTLVLRTSTS